MAEGENAEPVIGSCEGPDSLYVKLISHDEHEFIINRQHALTSTLEGMNSGPGVLKEDETNDIRLKDISSNVLMRICQYFKYRAHYENKPSEEIPEFYIAPEIALELLMAANFLDC